MEKIKEIIRYLNFIPLFPFRDIKRKKFRRKKTEKWYIIETFNTFIKAGPLPEIEEKRKISTAIRIKKIIEKFLFLSNHLIIKSSLNLH